MSVQPTDPVATLRDQLYGFLVAPVLYSAVMLEIPDMLAEEPATSAAIAQQVGLDPTRIGTLLTALAAVQAVERDAEGHYHLTAQGQVLCTTDPASLCDEVLFVGQALYPATGALNAALLADTIPFNVAFGRDFAAYLRRHPGLTRAFGRYISHLTAAIARAVVAVYDCTAYQHLIDVGGGLGTLAAAITARYPHLTAVVLDHASMHPEAERYLAEHGVQERCQFVSGDFFAMVPTGDLLVLCQVLHDLPDAQCQQVLQRCHAALAPQGRLLIVEMLCDTDEPTPAMAWRDLKMLIMSGGHERAGDAYGALLQGAGLVVTRVFPLTNPLHTRSTPKVYGIEARRADG